jgi:hypothetical protein
MFSLNIRFIVHQFDFQDGIFALKFHAINPRAFGRWLGFFGSCISFKY